ncbi:DUF362 domain-containing protein [Roseofilum casamattae]|uniref:DUF362 domain-containing protein n=1 Tax=Roseofilum casamattae BLCC-M143 TaxID=3022442 RepID=A0ABT7C2U2_9CYAN|nr:DUF362 domain-containing protein [Roseofilum casamattae]MDJ1185772.1 DUF362 domain-containing protein [Roseofilum casamattae BLCC-M143]
MSTVSLIRATSYDRALLRASLIELLAPLGGMEAVVKTGDRVLLKPNLLTGSKPTKECTTRPEVVVEVARLVGEAGGRAFLGDSPAFGTAFGVAKANGYLPFLEDLDLPIIEFQGKRYETAGDRLNHLLLSKEAMDADVVINLPKIKAHQQLTMTLGVKNLFGCVPGKMKAWWHMQAGKSSEEFGAMLVETARAIAPNLTIVDGIIAHEGNGPMNGTPRFLGMLGASTRVFDLDLALLQMLKVDPMRVPTHPAALAAGCYSTEKIDFPLCSPQELAIEDWKLPDTMQPIDFGLPRVMKSTFKHLYIRLIKEPMSAYQALKAQN